MQNVPNVIAVVSCASNSFSTVSSRLLSLKLTSRESSVNKLLWGARPPLLTNLFVLFLFTNRYLKLFARKFTDSRNQNGRSTGKGPSGRATAGSVASSTRPGLLLAPELLEWANGWMNLHRHNFQSINFLPPTSHFLPELCSPSSWSQHHLSRKPIQLTPSSYTPVSWSKTFQNLVEWLNTVQSGVFLLLPLIFRSWEKSPCKWSLTPFSA